MTQESGKLGEEHICQWLITHGYQILERNFHSRFGELDIVAQKPPYLVFVEVKTRKRKSLVSPFEAITPSKQCKLIATASLFLQKHPSPYQPRFDVAAVYLENGAITGEEYLENAFSIH